MSFWRDDARPALAAVLALQVIAAAATVLGNLRDGDDLGLAGHLGWTAATALLVWWTWRGRSKAAHVVLTATIALPLTMLLVFTLGPLDEVLIPVLIALSIGQLVLLWAPSVRQRLNPPRSDVAHY